jgi:hypothetical protein
MMDLKIKNGMIKRYIPFLITQHKKILCCRRRGLFRILLVESLNTTGRVKQLVLSGVVRMTRRADFDMDITHGRAGFEGVPAYAGHDRFSVFWVEIGFHCDAFYDYLWINVSI